MRRIEIGLLAFSLFSITAQAAPADLPETGQTSCTNTEGNVVDCRGTGQDADVRAGVAWPASRFTVDSSGDCVTDRLTKLMWVRNPTADLLTRQQALDYANGFTLCNASDWRLPNIHELESLVNLREADQATYLNGQGFSGIQSAAYWTSSNYSGPGSSDLTWLVHFNNGGLVPDRNSTNQYVWPVRTGQ